MVRTIRIGDLFITDSPELEHHLISKGHLPMRIKTRDDGSKVPIFRTVDVLEDVNAYYTAIGAQKRFVKGVC